MRGSSKETIFPLKQMVAGIDERVNFAAVISLSMEQTSVQFDKVIQRCKDIFLKKNTDYGTSWRILRPSSITDQLFIKATRIRGIETKGIHMIEEGIAPEFAGIINYSIMALIQMQLLENDPVDMEVGAAQLFYDKTVAEVKALMLLKNHDYGEAWREMRVSSFTDMILVRLMRIKQIEDNGGETLVSEGIESNYMDIINYAIFALIQLEAKA